MPSTRKRSVSSGLPGPTMSSHQPCSPGLTRPDVPARPKCRPTPRPRRGAWRAGEPVRQAHVFESATEMQLQRRRELERAFAQLIALGQQRRGGRSGRSRTMVATAAASTTDSQRGRFRPKNAIESTGSARDGLPRPTPPDCSRAASQQLIFRRTQSPWSWHHFGRVRSDGCPGFKGPFPQPVSMSGAKFRVRRAESATKAVARARCNVLVY